MIRRLLLVLLILLALAPPVAGQNGTIAPIIRHQFFDNNGDPCAGCKLYTYAAGTTTPLDTFTDVTLSTPNLNPIILDPAGRGVIYLSSNSYKFRLDSAADVTIWTQDTVSAVHAGVTGVTNTGDIVMQVDSDNSGSNKYSFTNGTGVEVAQISESGDLQIDGTLTVAGATTLTGNVTLGAGMIGGWTTVTTTAVGTQNDFTPGLVGHSILRANNATALTITGFANGTAGQRLLVVSVGAGTVGFSHQVTSTAANQLFNFTTIGTPTLAAGSGVAEFVYDGTTARWRMVRFEQGAWLTRTFSAGDYTGDGTITWTVAAGDVSGFRYLLRGRSLLLNVELDLTSTGGTASSGLRITLPGGFTTVAARTVSSAWQVDDATTLGTGYAIAVAAQTYVEIRKQSGNWSNAATNTTNVRGQMELEVQ